MAPHPYPIAQARTLIRSLDRATLAVNHAQGNFPYASLVLVACDHDLAPILLISRLAEHTKALLGDSRLALLYDGTAGLAQPLSGPRLSVIGHASQSQAPRLRARYLARHPDAIDYVGFGDFSFWRVEIERAHLVAGFGAIDWLDGGALKLVPAPELVAAEADIVAHMNADHGDAIALYAGKLLGLDGAGWRMTGIDGDGVDLRLVGHVARLRFARPIATAAEARQALVSLTAEARKSS